MIAKLANHAWHVWYVIPTLPMFLVFPALLSRQGFRAALSIYLVCFGLPALAARRLGVELLHF